MGNYLKKVSTILYIFIFIFGSQAPAMEDAQSTSTGNSAHTITTTSGTDLSNGTHSLSDYSNHTSTGADLNSGSRGTDSQSISGGRVSRSSSTNYGSCAAANNAAKMREDFRSQCHDVQDAADATCSPQRSQEIAALNQSLGMATQMISQATGVNSVCSGVGKAMMIGQAGLQLFQQQCSLKKMACDRTCGSLSNQLQNQVAALDADSVRPPLPNICFTADKEEIAAINREISGRQQQTIGGYRAQCQGYQVQLAMAALNAGMTLMALSQSNGCETATAALTPDQQLDCTKPENAQNPTCLCQANPRRPGCSGLAKAGSGNFSTISAAGPTAATSGTGTNPDVSGMFDEENSIAPVASRGGAQGNSPGGGGSGGGLLGGGGAGGAAAKTNGPAGPAGSHLDANILGGTGGGGGGGGWGGRGVGSDGMRAYMPGGAKDPLRNVAGTLSIPVASQVTNRGGMSNFEKVKRTYNENKTSLLAN